MAQGLEVRDSANDLIFGQNARLLRYVGVLNCSIPAGIPGSSSPPWYWTYNFSFTGMRNDGTWLAMPVGASFPYAAPFLYRVMYSNDTLILGLRGSSIYTTQAGVFNFRVYRI